MKLVATFAAAALVACLAGCQTNKTNEAAPGAVDSKACCKDGSSGACCKDKAASSNAAPGAVNGSGSGCCKDKANAAPGAVSGSGCCKDKAATGCPAAASNN
ncbi:MAG: hypothetical protein U0572_17905 [Phycisphaerales bacterium]